MLDHSLNMFTGLNKLSGLNIIDVRLLSGKDEILSDGSNLIANVTIPNPSVMTLDLGNITMNLAVDGTPIGYALIPNVFLTPHIAGAIGNERERLGEFIVEEIERYVGGRPLLSAITPSALETMA